MSAKLNSAYNRNLNAWRERVNRELREKKEHSDLIAFERQQGQTFLDKG